jgi:hypothetical protein
MGYEARVREARARMAREMADAITKDASNKGKLIEAGWLAMVATTFPKEGVSQVQYDEMRSAFFAGAHHLYASIMNVLDEDAEPTADDMLRMQLIHEELDAFLQDYKRRHGIPDDIVAPESGPRN